jgi:hypothetical protein
MLDGIMLALGVSADFLRGGVAMAGVIVAYDVAMAGVIVAYDVAMASAMVGGMTVRGACAMGGVVVRCQAAVVNISCAMPSLRAAPSP